MSDIPKANRYMSREQLKMILFDWLKERGILGELQAFLRMKMVEKLQGSELTASQRTKFSAKDDAINLMIYDYLKHNHMYYTMSVFASECSSIQKNSIKSLDSFVWKDILDSLNIHDDIKSDNGTAAGSNTQCLLNCILSTFGNISNKKLESKSCQCDVESNPKKLLLNTHSQTDVPVNTLSVQTLSPCHTGTQTEDNLNNLTAKHSSDELNSEIVKLQNMLEQSQSALKLCQSKLLESEKKIEYLVAPRKERTFGQTEDVLNMQSPTCNSWNRITCQKRIQDASRFLNHLDGRLQFLDQKYQSITATESITDEHERFLPDSNVSPLVFS